MIRFRLFATVCMAAAAQAAPVQQIKNPGMDLRQGKPAGWRFYDFRTGGRPLIAAHGGREDSSCVGVKVANPKQRGSWSQKIKLAGQRFVKVTGWYRTEGLKPARGRGATVRLSYRGTGKKKFFGDHRFYLPPSPTWKPFEFTDRVIEGADILEVELFNFFVPGTVWFDDVTCGPASAQEWAATFRSRLDQPPNSRQVGYAPADGERLAFTPPAFRWLPAAGVKRWRVQCSTDPRFPKDQTRAYESSLTIYTPHETYPPGRYYWRYGFTVEGADATVWSKTRRFTIGRNPLPFPRPTAKQVEALIPKTHPRVFLTPELVAKIRRSRDPEVRRMADEARRAARRYIGQPLYPEPPFLPKDRTARRNKYQEIFRTMRPFTAGMERCAFAYAVTGDRAAGQEAKRRLMHFMTWNPRGSTSVFHNDEPAMDLAKRGPRTFDWIYDLLTPAERKKCVEVFRVRLGEINRLHRRMPFETSPFSSHPGRMVPFVVEGSVVFYYDIPEAKDWLDYTLHLMWNTYPAWGSADGGWHEGPGYWSAYIGMMTRNVFGSAVLRELWTRKPFFQNTGYFGLYAAPAYAKQHPFGDGAEGRVGAGVGDILYSLATLHNNRYFRWYAEVFGRRHTYGPERFLAYRPDLTPKPPVDVPPSRFFPNIGLVAMHSDLADPTGSVQFLFKSDPYGSVSHNHASQNAFAVNAFGEALAISSGYYQQYGCPHHARWTRSTRAHNSITIDGKGQKLRGRDSNGRILRYWEDGDVCYALGDATPAYEGRLKRFHRHVLFLRPDAFVMVDDLAAPKPVSAEWRLHARNQIAVDEAAHTAAIASGDARLTVRFVEPKALTFAQTDKFPIPPHRPNSPNQWHLTVTPAQKSASPLFVTVLHAWRAARGEGAFQVRPVASGGFRGVEIGRKAGRALACVRLADSKGGPTRTSGVLTDAQALVIRRGSDWRALTGFAAYHARTVQARASTIMNASAPISASGQYGRREARIQIESDTAATCSLYLPRKYTAPRQLAGVTLVGRRGETVELRVEPGHHVLVFPAGRPAAVEPLQLICAGEKRPRPASPTVGSHVTAWLTRTDGLPAGLQEVEVKYAAPRGSRLILTEGPYRREWTAPGGDAVERFRWVLHPGRYPLTLLNEHGLDERARVRRIRLAPLKTKSRLVPARVDPAAPGVILVEAEAFKSHRGIPDAVRTKGRRKYLCRGALVYGVGDLVTRLDYDVTAPRAGAYAIAFKHAGDDSRTALSLQVNGECPHPAAELMLFGKTGGWGYRARDWRVDRLCDAQGKPVAIRLRAGRNRLTLLGLGGRMHIDWIALAPAR